MPGRIEPRPFLFFKRIHPPVFLVSAGILLAFIVFTVLFIEEAGFYFQLIQDFIVEYFGWYYSLVVAFFLGFVIWLMLSRYGSIRLGDDEDRPEFSYLSWFAMLFSAGMGIGLLFWGVAEPISHYMDPHYGEAQTLPAAEAALPTTYFHWGLHAWAIYIVVGLSLAYFSFRKKLPLGIRSAFFPLLGERIYGWIGDVIDVFAVFGTMFGVATSLGLGVIQVNTGLNYVWGLPRSNLVQILLIAGITGIATISVLLGLDKGIRRLSAFNMLAGAFLVLFLLFLGPTVFILEGFVENTGMYLNRIVLMTFRTDAIRLTDWLGEWKIFYWGWWIAWSPFVGMFIARISRGRTIREFIVGVLFVPTVMTIVWLNVFGGTALHFEFFQGADLAGKVAEDVSIALFAMLDLMPMALFTSLLAILVIITFFVTSSDSGSLVIDIITAGGDPDPPKIQRFFWAVTEGLIAAVLLVVGGLTALQTASISAGLAFSVIMVFMCYGLVVSLRREKTGEGSRLTPPP